MPFEFDPFGSHLVAGMWKDGNGCPSNAWTSPDGITFNTYTDGACTSGDPKDKRHAGLLLAKTGRTGNYASAGATLQGVKGIMLTDLGYDIRKQGFIFDPFRVPLRRRRSPFQRDDGGRCTHFVGWHHLTAAAPDRHR